MAPKKITVDGVGGVKLGSHNGYKDWLKTKGIQCLIDSDGDEIVDFESLEDGGTYTLDAFSCAISPWSDVVNKINDEFQRMAMEVHGIKEALPIVLVGHVVSPSEASNKPQVVATVFDALGLGLNPRDDGSIYSLPDDGCGPE